MSLASFQESKNSLRQPACRLTRDVAVSRVVLSCMQTLASSSTLSSSSTPSLGVNRRKAASQKTPTSWCSRFNNFVEVSLSSPQRVTSRHVQKSSYLFIPPRNTSKPEVLLLQPGCQWTEAARIPAPLQALRLAGEAFGRGSEGDLHAQQLPL